LIAVSTGKHGFLETNELASGQHSGTLVLASGRFVLFLFIQLAKEKVVVLNAIGGFNEVIAQGRIRLPVKRGLLRF